MRNGHRSSRFVIFTMLFVFLPAPSFCQSQPFTRFDIGYERIHYAHAPASNAVAIQVENSFGSSRFSRNYRLSIGETANNQFYAHIPLGTLVFAGVVAVCALVRPGCVGDATQDLGPLLLKAPDGFGFTPLQRDKLTLGMYSNFLSMDYTNRFEKSWDYAPDAGIRANFHFNERVFAFTRVSGKYSFGLSEWAAQGTFGIGWHFGTK
jgi:hypothetical protein